MELRFACLFANSRLSSTGLIILLGCVGVILYMMVVGELPFQDHSDTSTVFKILDVKYPIPDYMTQSCQDLIAAMLVRYASTFRHLIVDL